MVNIVLVEKTGDLKDCKFNVEKDELYKKCKFKKSDGFELRHSWQTKKSKYSFTSVSLYARDTGKANTENKYDLPPPIDNILYFGCIALVAKNEEGEYVDLSVEDNMSDGTINNSSNNSNNSNNSKDDDEWEDDESSELELEFEDYVYSDED